MTTTSSTETNTARYARCIESSKRVRWETERDVIQSRSFAVTKKFLPAGFSHVGALGFLSADEAVVMKTTRMAVGQCFAVGESEP